MREIDNATQRENKRKAKRYKEIIGANQESIQNLLKDENKLHERDSPLKEAKAFRVPRRLPGMTRRLARGFIQSCKCRPSAAQLFPCPRSDRAQCRERHKYPTGPSSCLGL